MANDEIIIICFVAATSHLDGVLLQWSQLFEPYALNFVQFRPVFNLTLSITDNDYSTLYTTLPMVFQNGLSHRFTVPAAALTPGAYYEFRLGYTFSDYTYYTTTQITKTFDSNSPFVNSFAAVRTDTHAMISWGEPEYSDGIVGYSVIVGYTIRGDGGLAQWGGSDSLIVILDANVPLTQTSIDVGCVDIEDNACLFPYTRYRVSIAVIREGAQDEPKAFYFTTKHMTQARFNTSSLHLYGGLITMNFTVPVPNYQSDPTPIASTFLSPVILTNKRGDIHLSLTESTVQSTSHNIVNIVLSKSEYSILVNKIMDPHFLYSSMTVSYGGNSKLHLETYCLLKYRDILCYSLTCILIGVHCICMNG